MDSGDGEGGSCIRDSGQGIGGMREVGCRINIHGVRPCTVLAPEGGGAGRSASGMMLRVHVLGKGLDSEHGEEGAGQGMGDRDRGDRGQAKGSKKGSTRGGAR